MSDSTTNERLWFRVEVRDQNGLVVAIESEHLAGREIGEWEEQIIDEAISNLSAFIGRSASHEPGDDDGGAWVAFTASLDAKDVPLHPRDAFKAGWVAAQRRQSQPSLEGPFVVADGGGTGENRFRTMKDGCSAWTLDFEDALQFARRKDAETFAADDEFAWQILPVPRLQKTKGDANAS
jgi:hypothetical protein